MITSPPFGGHDGRSSSSLGPPPGPFLVATLGSAWLAAISAKLTGRKSQRRWSDASHASLESEVFVAAFAIRKLIEAKKLSDEVEAHQLAIDRHARLAKVVDYWNWDRIDELYDLDKPLPARISIVAICNQLIHSFVLLPLVGETGGLVGLFVVSDRDKQADLIYLPIDQLITAIDAVASDDVVSLVSEVDGDPGERVVVLKSLDPLRPRLPQSRRCAGWATRFDEERTCSVAGERASPR